MIRRSSFLAPLAALALVGAMLGSHQASAQNESLLAEIYGRGVHAYYAGQYTEAYDYLTQAIGGGTRDPRAYYFRGIVAHQQGRPEEAEADWQAGAEMEARAGGGAGVGRSLSRFQGSARLKLEQIRQTARIDAMMNAAARSDARMQELGVQPGAAAAPKAAPAAMGTAPPPAPAAAVADDPFADDGPALADGQPKVENNNALEGLDDNPFADDEPAGAAAADAGMPAADNSNPFGEPAAPAAGDPFGGDAGADPFGAPAGGGDDPFGGDPFGN
ncbi:Tetratricopeptide repeat protein [Stieleria maiorica]|uniref:Tetratricopeptide repeat protein n=1 Tax=Stieleria maiorica TaxID=2795974 RepID=A0A5B9M7W8_9BACT|nr:tetratricopeptide repeat protein [Stieleria maiorica]QEF96753.1 Tetratricopeptide repeat protein [Stieleria maiorica]